MQALKCWRQSPVPIADTDSSGTRTRTSGHLPFGEAWYETGTSDKWKFTTYERDSGTGETGLDYAQFRHYASGQGRFMSADLMGGSPLAPQTLNRYAYAANNPINLIDPMGLESGSWSEIVFSGGCIVRVSYDWQGDNPASYDSEDLACTPGDTHEGIGGQGGGGGDGGGPLGLPKIPQKLYEDCAKKAFGGTSGSMPGYDRNIPGLDAASLVFDASLQVGIDPAVVGATMAIEHNSQLVPRNSGENKNGSIDVGPMQLNTNIAGEEGGYPIFGNAMGTNLGPGQTFNGDPYANIVTGANYLKMLGSHPERYVGNSPDRTGALNNLIPSMRKFFDCIRKGLGLS